MPPRGTLRPMRLVCAAHGTVTVEYTIVLTLVTLSCAAAASALAPRMLALFRVQMLVLSAPWLF